MSNEKKRRQDAQESSDPVSGSLAEISDSQRDEATFQRITSSPPPKVEDDTRAFQAVTTTESITSSPPPKVEDDTRAFQTVPADESITSSPPPKVEDDTRAFQIAPATRTDGDDPGWIQRLLLAMVAAATRLLRRRSESR